MHDLYVVSDLHLGRGKNPDTGRYYTLEAFFFDDDFNRFCHWLTHDARSRDKPFRLVLNGDVFDLLRIEPEGARPGGFPPFDQRYAPTPTPRLAARIVAQILAGHRGFTEGVAHVLASGYPVIFLAGNHDIETQWESVRAEVRRAIGERLSARLGDIEVEEALARLRFEPWFYHEPGRIWVEHGSQYDAECSSRYPLRAKLEPLPESVHESEIDLPFASFFQRYLYNAFGALTFIVPSTRANFRYFKFLLVNQPKLLIRVLLVHLPFLLQVVRRFSRIGAARKDLKAAHEEQLAELAAESGLGQRLAAIDELKKLHADVYLAFRELVRSGLKLAAGGLLVALFGLGLWFAGFHAINALQTGFWLKALLFLMLNFVLITGAVVGAGYAVLRGRSPSPKPLRESAERIAALLEVPIVTFGHTHDEVIWRLDGRTGGRSWYFNTGTWISVFTYDVLVPRERVQFTFLRVRGLEGELLHWSPGRGEPRPVILLEEPEADDPLAEPPPKPGPTPG